MSKKRHNERVLTGWDERWRTWVVGRSVFGRVLISGMLCIRLVLSEWRKVVKDAHPSMTATFPVSRVDVERDA